MKRVGHVQSRRSHVPFLAIRDKCVDIRLFTTQNRLIRPVDVRYGKLGPGHFNETFRSDAVARDRHHRAGVFRVDSVEGAAPRFHQSQGVPELKSPRSRQRYNLAETVSEHDARLKAHFLEHGESCKARNQHRGMSVACVCKNAFGFGWATLRRVDQARHGLSSYLAPNGVGPRKHILSWRIAPSKLQPHVGVLRTLAREEKGHLMRRDSVAKANVDALRGQGAKSLESPAAAPKTAICARSDSRDATVKAMRNGFVGLVI